MHADERSQNRYSGGVVRGSDPPNGAKWFSLSYRSQGRHRAMALAYNETRPHSGLGNQTPMAFKKSCCSTTRSDAVFQE